MNGYKSKHISMSAELCDRTTTIAQRRGCSFSKLVQLALKERVPQWERRIGNFDLEDERSFEIRMMEALIARSLEKSL